MPKGSWREFDDSSSQLESVHLSNTPPKHLQKVLVCRTKNGKAGKIVTIITGVKIPVNDSRQFLKNLKMHCGSGGTTKQGIFEIQGDHVQTILKFLENKGYRPKQSGG